MSLKMWRVTITHIGLVMAETEDDALELAGDIQHDGLSNTVAQQVSHSWKPYSRGLVWHDLPCDISEVLADKLCRAGVSFEEADEEINKPGKNEVLLENLADRLLSERAKLGSP